MNEILTMHTELPCMFMHCKLKMKDIDSKNCQVNIATLLDEVK